MTESHKNLPKSKFSAHLKEKKYDCDIDEKRGFAFFKEKNYPYDWKIRLSVAHD